MTDENSSQGVPSRLGPAIMLAGSVLTIGIIFLPWAKITVSDSNLDFRNGWYSGLQMMLPVLLGVLMLAPVVFSIIMLSGGGTARRNLEVGFCGFVFGMELLLMGLLLGLSFALKQIATQVDLFQIGIGIGLWLALAMMAANILGLILTGYGARARAWAAASTVPAETSTDAEPTPVDDEAEVAGR